MLYNIYRYGSIIESRCDRDGMYPRGAQIHIMDNGTERRYPDEFAIVDGTRKRRTIEDGVIVSFDLPTVYTEDGEIDADATTAYRKSIADAASTVSGLCATVHTTPWRLIGCAMRESSAYGEYASLLDSFDDEMNAGDFGKAGETLESIRKVGGSTPSCASCSTRLEMEMEFDGDGCGDGDGDGTDRERKVESIPMDDDGDEFREAAVDVSKVIDAIAGDYEGRFGADGKIVFIERISFDIMGSYPVERRGEADGGDGDDGATGCMTLREALTPAYSELDDADSSYVEAEGDEEAERAADRRIDAALRAYADELKNYGMENSPDYDAIITEIELTSNLPQ